MYTLDAVSHLHLEPTTRCNAACPMCARNVRGRTAPSLPLTQMTAAALRSMCSPDLLAQLAAVDMCGAYGDPAAAHGLLDVVGVIREARPTCAISVYSNGGLRTPDWWRRLATSLGEEGRVIFAIDGACHETNVIYRRGVSFEKVVDNARAFIGAGGEARWDYLAFRHNEHEIAAARRLAAELGFATFSVKKTDRFLEPLYDYVPEQGEHPSLDSFPVFDRRGEEIGCLEPPRDPALVNSASRRAGAHATGRSSLDSSFDTTAISCKVLDTNSLFLSAQGLAFPCCWVYVQATRPEFSGFPAEASRQVRDLVDRHGGLQALDTRRHRIADIVEGPLFAAIQASWGCASIGEGRLKVCARACGDALPSYFDMFERDELQPRSLQARAAPARGDLPCATRLS